ncbi:MAG: hypothetical protein U0610_18035 [bacterium]
MLVTPSSKPAAEAYVDKLFAAAADADPEIPPFAGLARYHTSDALASLRWTLGEAKGKPEAALLLAPLGAALHDERPMVRRELTSDLGVLGPLALPLLPQLLDGFIKKTQETPDSDLKLARDRRRRLVGGGR